MTDPELCRILKLMSVRRAVRIPEKNTAIRLGKKLKPIRESVFIGFDNRYYRSFIALNPDTDLFFKEIGSAFDFEFKKIF